MELNMEYLIALLVLGGFGYFLYTRVIKPKATGSGAGEEKYPGKDRR